MTRDPSPDPAPGPDEDRSLSIRLRADTTPLHREAERTGIMSELLKGHLERSSYVRLLHALQAIYEPLEDGLERHATHPGVEPIRMPDLYRSVALAEDIATLTEPGDAPRPLTPTGVVYRNRLRVLAEEGPELLAAHAWVRYLGDLSGGRALGRVVARALGPTGTGGGTAFYRFPDRVDPTEWKERFRAGLDALPGNGDALVAEAMDAFRLHIRLFEELAPERG